MALQFHKVKVIDRNQGDAEKTYLLKTMDEGFLMLTDNRIEARDYRVKDIFLICEMLNMEMKQIEPSTPEQYADKVHEIWKATVLDCA